MQNEIEWKMNTGKERERKKEREKQRNMSTCTERLYNELINYKHIKVQIPDFK